MGKKGENTMEMVGKYHLKTNSIFDWGYKMEI
jgi:hypothetical protein